MENVSQIGLKAQKRCIKTTAIGINILKTMIILFFLILETARAAIFGQFPANFRFSVALLITEHIQIINGAHKQLYKFTTIFKKTTVKMYKNGQITVNIQKINFNHKPLYKCTRNNFSEIFFLWPLVSLSGNISFAPPPPPPPPFWGGLFCQPYFKKYYNHKYHHHNYHNQSNYQQNTQPQNHHCNHCLLSIKGNVSWLLKGLGSFFKGSNWVRILFPIHWWVQ